MPSFTIKGVSTSGDPSTWDISLESTLRDGEERIDVDSLTMEVPYKNGLQDPPQGSTSVHLDSEGGVDSDYGLEDTQTIMAKALLPRGFVKYLQQQRVLILTAQNHLKVRQRGRDNQMVSDVFARYQELKVKDEAELDENERSVLAKLNIIRLDLPMNKMNRLARAVV